ncbi:MAG: hypothetical protein GY679_03630 [Mycoplasma sp.]|nr:hypothetical protein [Mycoplasma sp.]
MSLKAKVWLNMIVAAISVIGFIMLLIWGVHFVQEIHKINSIKVGGTDGLTEAQIDFITKGGQLVGSSKHWAGSNKTIADAILDFQEWASKNVDIIKEQFDKHKNLQPKDINAIIMVGSGKAQVFIGALGALFVSLQNAGETLFGLALAIMIITWLVGIGTSIAVKVAINKTGIEGKSIGIIFAVFKITGIPFLVTSIMSIIQSRKIKR